MEYLWHWTRQLSGIPPQQPGFSAPCFPLECKTEKQKPGLLLLPVKGLTEKYLWFFWKHYTFTSLVTPPGETTWRFLQAIASPMTGADWWDYFFIYIFCADLSLRLLSAPWTEWWSVFCTKVVDSIRCIQQSGSVHHLFLLQQKRHISKTSAIQRPEDHEPCSPNCYNCRSKDSVRQQVQKLKST